MIILLHMIGCGWPALGLLSSPQFLLGPFRKLGRLKLLSGVQSINLIFLGPRTDF